MELKRKGYVSVIRKVCFPTLSKPRVLQGLCGEFSSVAWGKGSLRETPFSGNLGWGDGILMPARKAVLSNMAGLFPLIWRGIAEGGYRARTLKPGFPSTLGFVRWKCKLIFWWGPHGFREKRAAQGGLEHLIGVPTLPASSFATWADLLVFHALAIFKWEEVIAALSQGYCED